MIQVNLQSKNRDTEVKNKRMNTYQGRNRGGWDELGDWDGHIYTTVYKIDN